MVGLGGIGLSGGQKCHVAAGVRLLKPNVLGDGIVRQGGGGSI